MHSLLPAAELASFWKQQGDRTFRASGTVADPLGAMSAPPSLQGSGGAFIYFRTEATGQPDWWTHFEQPGSSTGTTVRHLGHRSAKGFVTW